PALHLVGIHHGPWVHATSAWSKERRRAAALASVTSALDGSAGRESSKPSDCPADPRAPSPDACAHATACAWLPAGPSRLRSQRSPPAVAHMKTVMRPAPPPPLLVPPLAFAPPSGATTADDVCSPAATPCTVTAMIVVDDGSTLDFGTRDLVL